MQAYPITHHLYDVVVVGGGGAGLRASLGMSSNGFKTACISKIFPTRSHTVAAQGGMSAALNNHGDGDSWKHHFYDTIKGSDWLGDQDAIEYMCKNAPAAVIELEHMGVPFSRDENGKIYQRLFGGHTVNRGQSMARRACAAADRTGHAVLHTLYQQCLKHQTEFFIEYVTIDLIMDEDGSCKGVIAWNLHDGTLHFFQGQITVLATGGHGRVYANCTGAHTCTGDGNAMVARAGLPLQDMEFVQFHPTGIYKAGCLISEAARGEGGFLQNSLGEKFMEKYAPHAKDLASRDVVSRAITLEILNGRGCGPKKDYIELNLTNLPLEVLKDKLGGISEIAKIFGKIDTSKQSIPVQPTVHYNMGGIPTNYWGQVMGNDHEEVVSGLMAIGETACISVHGANRLGANSLLDIIVFGKAASIKAKELITPNNNHKFKIPNNILDLILNRFDSLRYANGTMPVGQLRQNVQNIMQLNFGVFRTKEVLTKGINDLTNAINHHKELKVDDQSLIWNTNLLEALELENIYPQAMAIATSALYRTESRGAHSRDDFPERDDENWLSHTMVWIEKNYAPKFAKRPVHLYTLSEEVEVVSPAKRVY